MKPNPHNRIRPILQRSRLGHLLIVTALSLISFAAESAALAVSVTWAPSSGATAGDWNTASNWSPMTVPNGSSDIAIFAHSFTTAVFISAYSGSGTLAIGTVFTVVKNISANPIFGTFTNRPEGSIITSNNTKFKVSYTGGTSNDMTLTVVP